MRATLIWTLALVAFLVLAISAPNALLVFGVTGGVFVAFLLGREVGKDEARRTATQIVKVTPGRHPLS